MSTTTTPKPKSRVSIRRDLMAKLRKEAKAKDQTPAALLQSLIEKKAEQQLADRLSIPLEELRHLAANAAIEAITNHLDQGNKVILPLELAVIGGKPIPFPCEKHKENVAREFIPPAQIGKVMALAEKGDWSVTAIAQFALAFGVRYLEENGCEILGLSPKG